MHFNLIFLTSLVMAGELAGHPNRHEVVTVEDPAEVSAMPPVLTPGDRADTPFGGGGGHFPSFPHIPGIGHFFGQRLPFDRISGPYVSSSQMIGPAFGVGPFGAGSFGGIGIPFHPGPLGGIMGVPLAMIAMG